MILIGNKCFALPRKNKTLIISNDGAELLIDCPFDDFRELYEYILGSDEDYDFISYEEWREKYGKR